MRSLGRPSVHIPAYLSGLNRAVGLCSPWRSSHFCPEGRDQELMFWRPFCISVFSGELSGPPCDHHWQRRQMLQLFNAARENSCFSSSGLQGISLKDWWCLSRLFSPHFTPILSFPSSPPSIPLKVPVSCVSLTSNLEAAACQTHYVHPPDCLEGFSCRRLCTTVWNHVGTVRMLRMANSP